MARKCSACGYRRRPKDDALFPDWQCPQCKRAYSKMELRNLRERFAQEDELPSSPGTSRSRDRFVTAQGGGAVREAEGPGILLLLIPVSAASLPWYWMLSATLIEGAAWKLASLTALMILATSVVTAFDATRLTIGSKHDVTPDGRKRPGPVFWSLVVLLFWAVAYPTYLYWRSRYGARNLAAVGVAIVLGFSATVAILGKEIRQASESGSLRSEGPWSLCCPLRASSMGAQARRAEGDSGSAERVIRRIALTGIRPTRANSVSRRTFAVS